MPALPAIVVDTVLSEHKMWVREHKGRRSKIDTILCEVDTILVGVPIGTAFCSYKCGYDLRWRLALHQSAWLQVERTQAGPGV